jgi:hypothetical protein
MAVIVSPKLSVSFFWVEEMAALNIGTTLSSRILLPVL